MQPHLQRVQLAYQEQSGQDVQYHEEVARVSEEDFQDEPESHVHQAADDDQQAQPEPRSACVVSPQHHQLLVSTTKKGKKRGGIKSVRMLYYFDCIDLDNFSAPKKMPYYYI